MTIAPVALTPGVMKCFEKLVMANMPGTLDRILFAYRSKRSMEDTISIVIHMAITHLDKRNTYMRMLFIDYSSVFNSILDRSLQARNQAQRHGSGHHPL